MTRDNHYDGSEHVKQPVCYGSITEPTTLSLLGLGSLALVMVWRW